MSNAPQPRSRTRWPLWLMLAVVVVLLALWLEPTRVLLGRLRGETFFAGRPTSYWQAALTSQDPPVAAKAEQALRAGDSAVAPLLAEMLRQPDQGDWASTQARWKSAELLGALGAAGREHAEPALIDALDDPDAHVRKVSAQALEKVGVQDPRHVPRLIALLNGPASPAAARALSKLRGEATEAVPALRALLTHEVVEVRWNAARTLGKIGTPALEALPQLIEQMNDPVAQVREHAAEALGDIGPEAKAGIPALVIALSDPDTKVRRDAVRSLGFMGSEARDTIPHVERLVQDPEQIVREAAVQALRTLDPTRPAIAVEKATPPTPAP